MCSFDYPRIYSLIFNHSRTVSFVISGWALDGCGVPGTGCTRVRAITYSYGLLVGTASNTVYDSCNGPIGEAVQWLSAESLATAAVSPRALAAPNITSD